MASSQSTAIQIQRPLRDGDVFAFAYSDAHQTGRLDLHWAFDGQVECVNGRLFDTYWGFAPASVDRREVRPDQGSLTFLCNLNEVRDIPESETRLYADADVINLSYQHGCYKRWVVKKDAQKSADKMLDEIRRRKREISERAESEARRALANMERVMQEEAKVLAGDLDKVSLSW